MHSNKLTAFISGLGLAIVTIILLKAVFNLGLLVAIAVGIIIGIALTVVLIARSRGEKVQEVVLEAIHPTPDSLSLKVEEQLLQLNLQIRLKTTQADIIDMSEKLIDYLLDLVPRAIKESPDSEATFDMEKLSTDYLPDLVQRYLSLSETDQLAQHSELLAQLNQLIENAITAKQYLDQGNLHEFEVANAFLHAKNG